MRWQSPSYEIHCSNCRDTNFLIECGCGCRGILLRRDRFHRIVRKYIRGHQSNMYSGDKNPNWKGGRMVGSQDYIKIFKPDHPSCDRRGYVHEHRYLMEQIIGRYLSKDEDVHHINCDKHDNRIENLQLMSHSEHMSISHKGKIVSRETREKQGIFRRLNFIGVRNPNYRHGKYCKIAD